jgi:hypothetical protein
MPRWISRPGRSSAHSTRVTSSLSSWRSRAKSAPKCPPIWTCAWCLTMLPHTRPRRSSGGPTPTRGPSCTSRRLTRRGSAQSNASSPSRPPINSVAALISRHANSTPTPAHGSTSGTTLASVRVADQILGQHRQLLHSNMQLKTSAGGGVARNNVLYSFIYVRGRTARHDAAAVGDHGRLVGQTDELAKWAHPGLLGVVIRYAAIGEVWSYPGDVGRDTVSDGDVGCQAEHDVERVTV